MQLVLKQAQSYLISTPDTAVIVHLFLYKNHCPYATIKPFNLMSYALSLAHKIYYLICLRRNISYICNLNAIF